MTPLIELQQITKTYNRGAGAVHALRGVSLTIRKGGSTCPR